MKSKVISGAALAAAAVSLALVGATPAAAHSVGHSCQMAKGQCGGKMKCMTKKGVCKHNAKGSCRQHAGCHHKAKCHHNKGACNHKSKCHSR